VDFLELLDQDIVTDHIPFLSANKQCQIIIEDIELKMCIRL